MFNSRGVLTRIFVYSLIFSLTITSCTTETETIPTATNADMTPVASSMPIESTSTPTITVTPVPMAMLINGVGIPLAEFEIQKFQLEKVLLESGEESFEEKHYQMIVDYLVDLELLSQGARAQGFTISDMELESRITALKQKAGGESDFNQWLAEMGYTFDSFRSAFRRELEAALQRDQVAATIGETAEQIHAIQILVSDLEIAEEIYQQLKAGADFATLAEKYDPVLKGELGWFPRGYLFLPEVEDAAFSLQPGQFSEIIETKHGYHILLVVDREENYPLSTDAKQGLSKKALEDWLIEQRMQSQIEVLVTPIGSGD